MKRIRVIRGWKDLAPADREEIASSLATPNAERMWFLRYAFKSGLSVDDIFERTKIDRWFLRNIEDYAAMNEVFASTFAKEPPTRTTVAAIIPRESLVEIDVIAYV